MNKKAIAAGHICLDITPVFPESAGRVSKPGDLLRPGTLIQMDAPDVHTGGSAANTGLAMKLLGADVRIAAKVGRDEFGGIIRRILNRYDAGGDLIECEGETTSYTVVLAVPGTDRLFLHCPGANDTFVPEDIPREALKDVSLFHFGYPSLMRQMYRNSGEALTRLFRNLKSEGTATSLDLAAVDPSSPAGEADWRAILEAVLPYTDFFVPSYEELAFMLDPGHLRELQEKAGHDDITGILSPENDIKPLAQKCLAMGAGAVLLKCGAPGLFLMVSDHINETCRKLELDAAAWNGFCAFEKSFAIDRVLSGTGAGDTSIAAFLTAVLKGSGPAEALEYAAAEGALSCTAYDALSGLKPLEEVRKMIDKGWRKN